MPEISIKQALNKAYAKIRPERAAIERFKANFAILLDGINHNPAESEEFLKNLVSDFLKNTWYAPDYFINTHKRVDLVIHAGGGATPVGVIIEAKKPGNRSEMISRNNLNAKAMQELLLYYLRETIDNKNLELKHLIITNTVEWFVFDAGEFYRHFSKNEKLTNLYGDFSAGSLLGKDTNYFYASIAAPYIDEAKNAIEYAYFDIHDYEKIIRSSDKKADNELISLYKILSPNHLLKKPVANDSNTLNRNFYFELLHLIGLTEEKKEGKKVIIRSEKEKRQKSSLIENIIFQLCDDMADENMLFDIALELSITWVNRILFLKLLEAQQLQYQGGNRDYAFLNISTVKTFNELNTLFFKVLAVKPKNREDTVREKYKNVPYLNSSLFEKTVNEKEYALISNLQNEKIDIFPTTVLKDEKGGKRKGEINILDYIFEFLDAYDFSSESLERIQEENKTLINASVLGLIFEKINGYKDGSFFTPGFITTYICREVIREAVINKFNESKGWNVKTLDGIYNKIDDIFEANDIVNGITVCDPAVGSGHFLVSALNEIIAVKSELRILTDSNGRRIKCEIKVANDELAVFDEDGESFSYNYKNEESRRVQKTLFAEKRRIIENCLFGVDINRNSVKICRLRLWIELLKSAYYTEESGYTELETLPNLDINIKCGNSLISRFDLNAGLTNSTYTIREYREAADAYKNSSDKKITEKFLEIISAIKTDYGANLKKSNRLWGEKTNLEKKLGALGGENAEMDFVTGKQLEEKNRQIQKLKTAILEKQKEIDVFLSGEAYDDAFEWRFEFPEVLTANGDFTGFDCVIGNPPYVSAPAMSETNPRMRQAIVDSKRFSTLHQKWDIYVPFMELGIQLLAHNGRFAMIAPYPLTNQTYAKKLRELIVTRYNLTEISDLGGTKVFENAAINNCIPFISKSPPGDGCFISRIDDRKQITRAFRQSFSALVQDEETCVWNLTEEKRNTKRHSTMNILGDFCYISVGMVLNSDEKTAKGQFTKEDLIRETWDEIHCEKYIEAKDIERYRVKKIRYLEYGTERCPSQLRRPTFRELYEKPKLMFNRLGNLAVVLDGEAEFLHSDSMFSAVLWKDLKGIDNKSISASVKRYSRFSRTEMENMSAAIDLRYLLGLLNSKYASALLSDIRGGDYHIYPEHLRNLPVPPVSESAQRQIISLVDKIIAAKIREPTEDISAFEKQLDALVYLLYGVTENKKKAEKE
jgi:hypothetical protein